MDLKNHRLLKFVRKHSMSMSRTKSISTPSLGPFETLSGGEMVSRRRILSRSRDDLTQAISAQIEEEEDVWYQKDKLYKEHIQEVLDKWTQIDDEIWAKVIVFEKNRRVAKAYARAPVLTINGSTDGFDGMRIGLCGFDNPHRDQKTIETKRHIGQGVKIKMDDAGNILIRRYSKTSVFVRSTAATANEETAIGQDILKLPGYALDQEKIFKLFDMKRFQANVNRELRRSYPDRRRLEAQCLSAIGFVKAENDLLDCPIWVLIINVVAMDMLKSKLPPVPTATVTEATESLDGNNVNNMTDIQAKGSGDGVDVINKEGSQAKGLLNVFKKIFRSLIGSLDGKDSKNVTKEEIQSASGSLDGKDNKKVTKEEVQSASGSLDSKGSKKVYKKEIESASGLLDGKSDQSEKVQRPMDIKNRPRIPIPDEDPYSIATNTANGSGSSGSSGYGLGNGHGVVAATREQLMMQMGQRRGDKPPKLPPRETGYGPADIPKPDYDDIEDNRLPNQFPRGKSDKGKDNKKYDDPYYCGLRARVPNFVKANGVKILPAMAERLTLKDAPVPTKRFSVAHAHPGPFPPHMAPYAHAPLPPQALWHARSYESGIDGEHYDPYALYGRLPMPGRGFPPYPMQQQQKMYIEDWD
ncbi:uncharacterized protein [Choristoneura fumiferana]|uniref:uncharacterized protein n=1 Tax=Choristoneura fumiferana TaxID=7141 RepID=UPI003D15EA5C